MQTWTGIGVMSGSSLDGVDVATCRFELEDSTRWHYQVLGRETLEFPPGWRDVLQRLASSSASELVQMHFDYAHWLGTNLETFIRASDVPVQFVGVHGHTVFHRPHTGITFQLGCGETLANYCRVPVVTNFRAKDLGLGGVGAPLVPVGEQLLFPDYSLFLNLGGIVNLTTPKTALDVCMGNQVLDDLARRRHPDWSCDLNGQLARHGILNPSLLQTLNALEFYQTSPPRALDREWYDSELKPMLDRVDDSPENIAATYVEHIAHCTIDCLPREQEHNGKMLITGGGRLNQFLFERLRSRLSERGVQIPEEQDETLTLFKEALVFGFLALLDLLGQANVDGDITGAGRPSRSGSIHLPPSSDVPLPLDVR